mmetsp:Transcript_25630/g.72966  ORF Transcript_25630/g.72966 Transcript_25630/m.72966 type:complete len:136 (+) Transcript_25630:61-468(+)
MMGSLEQCIAGCWAQCGKKCVVDEDEIEIVGPLRQFSSSSGWLPGWVSRGGSSLCTPRRPGDHQLPETFGGSTGWLSRTGSAMCTPRMPSDVYGGFAGAASDAGHAAFTGPSPTPRSGYNSRIHSGHRTPRVGPA